MSSRPNKQKRYRARVAKHYDRLADTGRLRCREALLLKRQRQA